MIHRLGNKFLRRFAQDPPAASDPFLRFAPSGHFYSPLPNEQDIGRMERGEVQDIDLNEAGQRQLLIELSQYTSEMPFQESKGSAYRYYFDQPWYCYGDATYLYSLMRRFRPQRYLEIGSGFSSAVALDTSD